MVDLQAVPFDGIHGAGVGGRHARVDQRGDRVVDLVALGLEPLPVLLGVALGAARRFLVRVGLAPALLDLVLVLGGVEVAEDLEHVLFGHGGASFERTQ
jgi:hypothetical protein